MMFICLGKGNESSRTPMSILLASTVNVLLVFIPKKSTIKMWF